MIRILILSICAALTGCVTTGSGLKIEYRGHFGEIPVSVRYAGGKTSILVDSHGRPQPTAQK